jgi:hypothetical protein
VLKGEEIQTKGIDNLLNKITAKIFPNLENMRILKVLEAYRAQNIRTKKETSPDIS